MAATHDRVFVNWTEQWELERYIENYVRSRRLSPAAREFVRDRIATYPGSPPITKSDLDFYLDANVGR
jgi:hypothetical protein